MNVTQKQIILNNIELILAFDFNQLISENNPSGNLEEIKFGEYSAVDFKTSYLKVFKQLKAELESGLGLMLPNQDIFNNEFSSLTMDAESGNFYSYLQSFSSRNDAAEVLKRFIYYQIIHGFWNKSTVKQHSVDVENLNAAQEKLHLVQSNLSENLIAFDKLKSDFTSQINEFENVLEEKRAQSIELTSLLEQAKVNDSEISNFLSVANNKDVEITGFATNIKTKLSTITSNIEEYKVSFSQIITTNKALSDELKQDLANAKSNVKDAKEGIEYIQAQKSEITRLIGMAADGSLGYKFDSRKSDLEKGVNNFWRWAVPASILLALGWVVIIFTCLNAHLSNEWINLLVNIVKTSPAWLLVGFVFSQYGKERNLQEEYAFKSAIAMTLTAYSQMLAEDDASNTKTKSSKQEMLLKSIENLYTQPVLKIDKGDKQDTLTSKQFNESLKSITEMLKSIKG